MTGKFREKLKKNWLAVATLSVSAAVLLFFFLFRNGIPTLAGILLRLRAAWFAAALAAVAGGWMLEAAVLHVIVQHVWKGRGWGCRESYHVAMIGLLYGALTPSAAGGQPMQVYTMHGLGMDTGVACSAVTVKTLTYQVVMVFYALAMVCWKLRYFQTNVTNFSFLTVIGILCNSAYVAVVFLFLRSERATDRILRWGLRAGCRLKLCRRPEEQYARVHGQLELFHTAGRLMGNSVGLYAAAALLTAAQITLNSLIPYFLYRSFGLHGARVATMVAAQVFVTMVSAFVPLPGSTGGAEGCFYLFFGPYFGASVWAGVLLWRFLTYYFNILFGAASAYWFNRRVRRRKGGQA